MGKRITRSLTDRIWELVGMGLPAGLGERGGGTMCVQASVAAALGEEHSDEPSCVPLAKRAFGIHLNDTAGWSSDKARGDGLRRYAIAQLGTSKLAERRFGELSVKYFLQRIFPQILEEWGVTDAKTLRAAAELTTQEEAQTFVSTLSGAGSLTARRYLPTLGELLVPYDEDGENGNYGPEENYLNVYAIYLLWGGGSELDDERLTAIAECGVQACIEMKTEGAKWLKEYESRSGSDLVEWLAEEAKKGKKQEAQAKRFRELRDFLESNDYKQFEPEVCEIQTQAANAK